MKRIKQLSKRVTAYIISFAIIFTTLNIPVKVEAASYDTTKTAANLVSSLLGSGIEAKDASSYGKVYSFTGGIEAGYGIDSGIMLDTCSDGQATTCDSDLKQLMANCGMDYGNGHVSEIEFSLTATGSLLNFNYAFASCEFNQGVYDVFGLFVSVNGGAYENIAYLPDSSGNPIVGRDVNIKNIRAGFDGTKLNSGISTSIGSGTVYDYFTAKAVNMRTADRTINGITKKFNAQKKVKVGDNVKVKFVIGDASDASYDSYVMIEAGSLSFEPPGSRPDYGEEKLVALTAGARYEITCDGETYTFVANSEGKIPLQGIDTNGKEYDFIGKTLSIIQKGEGSTLDSEPQEVDVSERPDTPQDPEAPPENNATPTDVTELDVTTTTNSIVIKGVDTQEYTIDGSTTWKKPDADNNVKFTGLISGADYTIQTRIFATDSAPCSDISTGITVHTWKMFDDVIKNNYSGTYDQLSHTATVSTDVDGATIKYGTALDKINSSTPTSFTHAGNHKFYYSVSKEGYYTEYGELSVNIGTVSVQVKAKGATKVYGEEDPDFEYEVMGLLGTDEIGNISCTRMAGENTGSYKITPSQTTESNQDYAITFVPALLTIKPKPITVTPDDKSKIFGESDPVFTYKAIGLVGTDTLTNISINREVGDDVGEYEISASKAVGSNENYSITFNPGTFKIEQKELTADMISLDSTDGSYIFTGNNITPVITVEDGDITLSKTSDYILSGDTTKKDVDDYEITVSGTGNYKGSVNIDWTIKDETKPNGEISISDNSWTQFMNIATFGLFYNETQDVIVTANDGEGQSGIDKLYIYTAESPFNSTAALEENANWQEVESGYSVSIDPDSTSVVYVKIVDQAGNVNYISSDWVVLDHTAPTITGVADGKVYCDEKIVTISDTYLDYVEVNGETVTLTDNKYKLLADGTTYNISAYDKAGNYTSVSVTVNANHTWNDGTITFAADGKTATGTRVCEYDSSHTETVNCVVTNEVKVPAKCLVQGTTTYTATATFAGGSILTDTKDVVDIPTIGHDWENGSITFSADGKTATGTRICKNDRNHTQTVNAVVSSKTKIPATCTEKGTTTYTAVATFADGKTATNTKDVIDIQAIGHDWDEGVITFSKDGKSATGTRTCKNDSTHTQTVTCVVTNQISIPATCMENGTTTYTAVATFEDGRTVTKTKDVADVPFIGHNYRVSPIFTWNDDLTNCTATFVCQNDNKHTDVVNCAITKDDKAVDKTIYTASVNYMSNTYTDVVKVSKVKINSNQKSQLASRIVVKEGCKEIDDTLVDAGLDSEVDITEKMEEEVLKNNEEFTKDTIQNNLFNVELQLSKNGGTTWSKATESNFPKEGLTVVLPYPEGTDRVKNNYIVTHMFTHNFNGCKAGDVETPKVTETDKGIQFVVKSLSPILISWTAAVTQVTLNRTKATLTKDGEQLKLVATIKPKDALNKKVKWKSSDPSVAKVNQKGEVIAVGNGKCKITVTTEDGNNMAFCIVTVKIPSNSEDIPKTSDSSMPFVWFHIISISYKL